MRSNHSLINQQNSILLLIGFSSILAAIFHSIDLAQACGPGRAGGRRALNRLRKYPPLVQRQYIPNVSENTLGASGRPEGAIGRKDQRFKELVQNWNPDIEFRDDERTGADRMMSQRLKEKLSVLAISVMNQWPNVKLRVIEGWDEDYRHSVNSLHYEGRAVDITTSDKDKSKYGMLARLAVEAGFDWVHYESRSHVHCSVKSEKADTIRNNGCFDANSLVETPMGPMEMSQLQTNDLVLAMNSQTGELQYSPVIMWLDRDEANSELYVELKTKSGQLIRLTSSHLIYTADEVPELDARHSIPTEQMVQQEQLAPPPVGQATRLAYDLLANSGQQQQQQRSMDDGCRRENDSMARGNGEINNNYYYYDFNSAQLQPSSKSNDNITAAPDNAILSPSDVSSTASNVGGTEQKKVDLRDFVYTNYARNIIVGQYVLVSSPEEQVVELTTSDNDVVLGQAPSLSLGRTKTHPGRLTFSTGPDAQQFLSANELSTNLGVGRVKLNVYNENRNKILHQGGKSYRQQLHQTRKPRVKFEQIVSVNYVNRLGIYAPLTREGNIVVNSVVASCYAVISDHDMAHWSFAPVRWLSVLQERLFGLRPETPVNERLARTIERRMYYRKLHEKQLTGPDLNDGQQHTNTPNYNTTNSLNRTVETETKSTRHIHWYPILLYNIAKIVLPDNYLY